MHSFQTWRDHRATRKHVVAIRSRHNAQRQTFDVGGKREKRGGGEEGGGRGVKSKTHGLPGKVRHSLANNANKNFRRPDTDIQRAVEGRCAPFTLQNNRAGSRIIPGNAKTKPN